MQDRFTIVSSFILVGVPFPFSEGKIHRNVFLSHYPLTTLKLGHNLLNLFFCFILVVTGNILISFVGLHLEKQ